AWWCGLLAFPLRALGGHGGGDTVAFGLLCRGLTVPFLLAARLFGPLGGFTLPLLLPGDGGLPFSFRALGRLDLRLPLAGGFLFAQAVGAGRLVRGSGLLLASDGLRVGRRGVGVDLAARGLLTLLVEHRAYREQHGHRGDAPDDGVTGLQVVDV